MDDLKRIDIEQIEEFIIFQRNLPENEQTEQVKSKIELAYMFGENMQPVKSEYDTETERVLYEYLVKKGVIDPEDEFSSDIIDTKYIEEAGLQGIITRYNSEDLEKLSEIENRYQKGLYADTENDKHLGKTLAKGAALTAAGIAALGAGHHIAKYLHDKDQQDTNIDYDNATFDEIMNSLSEDSEKRKFSQSVYDVTEKLNTICSCADAAIYLTSKVEGKNTEYFFSMDEDKYIDAEGKEQTALLQFTTDEVMAAKVVLNNYTPEQMIEIFGMEDINSQEIFNNYQKFASKMLIYSMNGKTSSGVSLLIDNEANRDWFEQIENSIVEFNKAPSQDKADKVIRTFAYFYNHGINGVDNINNDEASLNAVKNLAMHVVRGYYDSNANSDYLTYRKVASEPGSFDDKYRTEVQAQVQSGETLKFYLDLSESGKCTLSEVEQNIQQNVQKLNEEQNSRKDYDNILKMKLSQILVDENHADLASELMTNGMSTDLASKIEKSGHSERNALEEYIEANAILNTEPTMTQILAAADKDLGPYVEVKDDILFNNRIRGRILIDQLNSNNKGAISKEEWDKKTHDEKVEYAKQNGEVVSTKTETKKTEINESDLTPSEKVEIDKQKEELKYTNDEPVVDNSKDVPEVTINVSTYKGLGYADGVAWATSGTYNYGGTIDDPNTGEVIYQNGKTTILENTYYDIAKYAYAYEGKTLTPSTSDSSIKSNIDSYLVKRNVSDDRAKEAYTEGWLNGVSEILKQAVKDGELTRQEADRLYNEAKSKENVIDNSSSADSSILEQANNSVQEIPEVVAPPVVSNDQGVYDEDPNLNTDTSNDGPGLTDEELEANENFFNINSSAAPVIAEDATIISESPYESSTIESIPNIVVPDQEQTSSIEEPTIIEDSFDNYSDLSSEEEAIEAAMEAVKRL